MSRARSNAWPPGGIWLKFCAWPKANSAPIPIVITTSAISDQ